MASHITDPKDFAQRISEKMLADFLHVQNPPIPFEVMEEKPGKKKRISENAVVRFIETIKQLPDQKKAHWLSTEILYINELCEQRHVSNLEDQAIQDNVIFGVEDDYGKCASHYERVFWWYIYHKDIFEKYFERADTENLAGLREVIIKDKYIVDKEKIAEENMLPFGEKVAKIYENVLRGKKFRVSPFVEKDCILVRVYLENLPENYLIFTDIKDKQPDIERTASIRSLFNVLFVYNPEEKTLGIRTTNPAVNVPKLADLFCGEFLGCTYADTTERKYNVEDQDSIRKLDLTPEPIGPIERCYLKAVEYMRIGDISKTLRLDIGGKQQCEGTIGMENMVDIVFKKESDQGNDGGTKESEWIPKKFEIKFIFRKENNGQSKKRYITVTLTKRGVNLKNTPEDRIIKAFLRTRGLIS